MKSKAAIPKIKANNLGDYFKVCRLKEIPDYYTQYFILYVSKASESKAQSIIEQETKNIVS